MMNTKSITQKTLMALSLSLILVPTIVFAQTPDPQQFDSQIENGETAGSGLVPCSGTNCSACHLAELGNTLVGLLIGLVAIVFATLMVVAGFRLVTSGGNRSARDAAKNSLTNAVVGLLLILGAWLLVDTLMRALVGDGGEVTGYGPWTEISCWEQRRSTEIAVPPDEFNFVATGGDHGSVAVRGAGSNCPAAPRDSVVQIPSEMVSGEPEYLTRDALERFTRLHNAAKADGVTILVSDGWRSEEEQVYLYNKYKGKSAVATPCSLGGGGSNHNSGVAVDLEIGCAKTDSSCNSRAYNWMKENGGEYGFNNVLPRDTVHWSPTGR